MFLSFKIFQNVSFSSDKNFIYIYILVLIFIQMYVFLVHDERIKIMSLLINIKNKNILNFNKN